MRRLREASTGRDDADRPGARATCSGIDRSPRESYRRYAERVDGAQLRAWRAQLHNATSAAQRREAAKKLTGYEADLRALIGDAAS